MKLCFVIVEILVRKWAQFVDYAHKNLHGTYFLKIRIKIR